MAIPRPDPSDWSRANARELQLSDREVLELLRNTYKAVNAELQDLVARDSPLISAGVKRAQLEQTRLRLLAEQGKLFDRLGDKVSARRARAAARAQRLSAAADAALLSVVGKAKQAQFLYESALETSQRAIDTALGRMRLSTLPLSQRIYRTQVWMDGRLGKLINETLAAGINAREFAKKARDWFNPNTPGGVRYAAMRLARTEINNAFHALSAERAAQTPWVKGVEWHLSGSHPKRDICNDRADDSPYDSDNVPARPHPQCLCFITPISVHEDEFVENFLKGDYDDYLDQELEKNGWQVPEDPAVAFDRSIKAAASESAALQSPQFGLSQKDRPAEFTPQMSRAMNTYSGSEYAAINKYLRGQRLPFGYKPSDIKPTIKSMDAAFKLSKLTLNSLLYRGVLHGAQLFGDRINNDLTGLEWKEEAYLSTTALQRRASLFSGGGEHPIVMRILAKRGTPAVELSGEQLEAEVLLKRGLKLRVVRDRGIDNSGVRQIDVEIIDG